MEERWVESNGGRTADQWLSETYENLKEQPEFWSVPIADPGAGRIFHQAVYIRGGMALQALRNKVGDEVFWQVLRTWVATRAGGNGTVEDFRALAGALSGQDLGVFFDAWLGAGRPARTAANGFTS